MISLALTGLENKTTLKSSPWYGSSPHGQTILNHVPDATPAQCIYQAKLAAYRAAIDISVGGFEI